MVNGWYNGKWTIQKWALLAIVDGIMVPHVTIDSVVDEEHGRS